MRYVKCGLIGDWELTSQHKIREGVIFVASVVFVLVYSSHAIAKSNNCIAVCMCERVGGEWRATAKDGVVECW